MEIEQNKTKPKKGNVQFADKDEIQEFEQDEEAVDAMIYDSQAYEMLHRAKVEWPCLSLDFLLPERMGEP